MKGIESLGKEGEYPDLDDEEQLGRLTKIMDTLETTNPIVGLSTSREWRHEHVDGIID